MAGTPLNVETVESMPPLRVISISARAGEVFLESGKGISLVAFTQSVFERVDAT